MPAYARELVELVGAVRDDRPVSIPPSEARAALVIALAAVQCAHTGQTVTFDSADAAT
jgi:hypothetical protein